jgi:multiple sugar transport system ATP-binding protein
MTEVTLNNVTKIYDDAQGTDVAVEDFSLTIEDGEFVVLVGPSGCGKSTTLRLIAALESITEGQILFDGEEVQMLNATSRNVSMAFQNYALYPNMTARANIGYGLKHSTTLSKSERNMRIKDIAEMMGIVELLDKKPDELSGGQKQRVALARALVREPDVFLLDEPLSNLDAKLRSTMRRDLQRIHNEIGITSVYVTHDQTEAMTMADRIVVMKDGQIQQIGDAVELYNSPSNLYVATFIGSPSMNTVEVSVDQSGEEYVFGLENRTLTSVPTGEVRHLDADVVRLGFRPEDAELYSSPSDGTFEAELSDVEYQGNENFVHIKVANQTFTTRTDREFKPDRGDIIGVSISSEDVFLFDISSGESIKTKSRPEPHAAEAWDH